MNQVASFFTCTLGLISGTIPARAIVVVRIGFSRISGAVIVAREVATPAIGLPAALGMKDTCSIPPAAKAFSYGVWLVTFTWDDATCRNSSWVFLTRCWRSRCDASSTAACFTFERFVSQRFRRTLFSTNCTAPPGATVSSCTQRHWSAPSVWNVAWSAAEIVQSSSIVWLAPAPMSTPAWGAGFVDAPVGRSAHAALFPYNPPEMPNSAIRNRARTLGALFPLVFCSWATNLFSAPVARFALPTTLAPLSVPMLHAPFWKRTPSAGFGSPACRSRPCP